MIIQIGIGNTIETTLNVGDKTLTFTEVQGFDITPSGSFYVYSVTSDVYLYGRTAASSITVSQPEFLLVDGQQTQVLTFSEIPSGVLDSDELIIMCDCPEEVAINNAIASSGTPPYVSPYRISLAIDDGSHVLYQNNIVYETDDLDDMIAYVASYSFTGDMMVQYNHDFLYQFTSRKTWTGDTGGNLLYFGTAGGNEVIFDAQEQDGVVMVIAIDNTEWKDVAWINADIDDSSTGSIIKFDDVSNLYVHNFRGKRGAAFTRSTVDLVNIRFEDGLLEEIWNGSFRLGDGARPFPDVNGLILKNITIDCLNGADIPGTSYKVGGYVLLKKVQNGNVNIICINGTCDLGDIESCDNTTFEGFKATNFKMFTSSDTYIYNMFLSSQSPGALNCQGMSGDFKIYYSNIFNPVINNSGSGITDLNIESEGNIFKECWEMYALPGRTSLAVENWDVITQNVSGRFIVASFDNGDPELQVHAFGSIPAYRGSGFGVNSEYLGDGSNGTTNEVLDIETDGYLSNTSAGRNMILADLNIGTDVDITGATRVYPGDVGPYDNSVE